MLVHTRDDRGKHDGKGRSRARGLFDLLGVEKVDAT